jgi:Bacterial CdiA-CT RNAse A domain
MPQPPSAYDLHQRERWTRHDAHLWIRPDAARWLKPGTDPAEVYPTLQQQREAGEDAAFAAKIAASRRFLAALRAEVDELKAALAKRRLEEAKYSPTQPRVPAGNPRGGQWTDRSEGQGTDTGPSQDADLTLPMGNVELGDVSGSSELSDLFRIKPSDTRTDAANLSDSIGKIAADDSERRYSVDLREEEARGGHTLRDHVGKTDEELLATLRERRYDSPSASVIGKREGSFDSVANANDFVNRTLEQNRTTVDMVVNGKSDRDFVTTRFGNITGREAFRSDPDADPYLRNTYSVGVEIRRDPGSSRGYRVHTAYPRND